jgi:riboflavin biosynthesis protein RibD
MSGKDLIFMKRAIDLASRGAGFVNPNPQVGCVVVKNGLVIGEGWHNAFGDLHAERHALNNCTEDPGGATLYVSLEPCCHFGKTPPCTDIIIEKGIKRVVAGIVDPNPLVSGKGFETLRQAGVEVEYGLEADSICYQNRFFIRHTETKMPWVMLKTAMTMDGKSATSCGDSKWISNTLSRQKVHRLRHEAMAVMVGIATVEADDCMLNCRLEGEVCQPVRIVVDSFARLSTNSKLVQTAHDFPVVVAHTQQAPSLNLKKLQDAGVELLECNSLEGRVDVCHMIKQLGMKNIDSVLLEGGGTLNFSFAKSGLIDEVFAFVAPKLIGGLHAKTSLDGEGFAAMSDSIQLEHTQVEMLGNDVLIHSLVKK